MEAEKEKSTNPAEPSDKEKEEGLEEEGPEEESSEDSSDSTSEEEKSTNPAEPQTSNLEDTAQEEVTEEHAQELSDMYRQTMQPRIVKVEQNLQYAATRTVVALFHGTVGSLAEPVDILPEQLKELQTLGEVNQEALKTLDKGRNRSEQLRLLLKSKEAHLLTQKANLEQELSRKINWVQRRLAELQAEDGAIEKMISFHESVEEYAVRSMEALKSAQGSRAATIMSWPGLSFDTNLIALFFRQNFCSFNTDSFAD